MDTTRAALGSQAAIPAMYAEGPKMAHSRTSGVRTPDPKRTFDLSPPKVRMGWGAGIGPLPESRHSALRPLLPFG